MNSNCKKCITTVMLISSLQTCRSPTTETVRAIKKIVTRLVDTKLKKGEFTANYI